ncbi:MAG: formylglycine-generating enzyme family protein [Chloroflexi bacterium]|nr:formylglycine-generating enzyme family protein [Chloroflexota bacterium]
MAVMVRLAGGRFEMGTAEADLARLPQMYGVRRRELFAPEVPRHPVRVDPFLLDVYPVTNAEFKRFVDAAPEWAPSRVPAHYHNGAYLRHWNGDEHPPAFADHPVANVSWYAAMAYARWAGKRLPTEAEWEFAARGGRADAEFPWGSAPPDASRANYGASGLGTTTPVGSYPSNPYGLYDLAGNVWEYCLDEWQADFYARSPQENPLAGGEPLDRFVTDGFFRITARRVIRGGSWGGTPLNLRVAYRDSHPPSGAGNHVGFRCARPVP